jgi:hypothetical protein
MKALLQQARDALQYAADEMAPISQNKYEDRHGCTCPVCTAIEAIDAELAKPEQDSGWMPIESAPKDSAHIVVIGNNNGRFADGVHYCIAAYSPDENYWHEVSDRNNESSLTYLTHWMPLPPPPEAAK